MALTKVKSDLTEARLAGLVVPQGADAARQDALARLGAMGLPTKRDEYWRYTDPSSFTAADPAPAALFYNDEGPLFADRDRVRIVFVDGVFDAEKSDDFAAEGVEITLLSDALTADIHWAKDFYGTLEARGQVPVERPLAAMNTAFAAQGVAIRATAKAAKPINLIYLHEDTASDAILHNLVKVDAGAEVTLLETGPAAARFNKLLEVDVADGGTFHHVRAQGRDHERQAVTHIFAHIEAEATFKSFTMTANGRLTRNECQSLRFTPTTWPVRTGRLRVPLMKKRCSICNRVACLRVKRRTC